MSRKRFVKLMMGRGLTRNRANEVALLGNYDTYEDPESVSALETLVRNIEAVMNFEEDKHATDRC